MRNPWFNKIANRAEYHLANIEHKFNYFFHNMKLSVRLLLTILGLSLIPLLLVTLLSIHFFQNDVKKQVIDSSENITYLMAVSMNQIFESVEECSIQIISLPVVTEYLNVEEKNTIEEYYARKNLETNYMKSILGAARYVNSIEIESNKLSQTVSFGYNRSGDHYLSKQVDDDQQSKQEWFYLAEDENSNETTTLVYKRQILEFGSGVELGNLFIDIKNNSILDVLQQFNYEDAAEIQLLDSYGHVISGSQKFFSSSDIEPIFESSLFSNTSSGSISKTISGREYYIRYLQLYNGWYITYIMPYAEVFHSSRVLGAISAILCVVAAIAVSICAVIISGSITRPIATLVESIEKVEQGNFETSVPITTGGEIGSLCRGYNIMLNRIQALFYAFGEEQRMKNEAELRNLQSQISPHFVYNILTSLKYDALINNNHVTADVLDNLIRLLRKSLDFKREIVSISEEINLAKDYLCLQSFRYKDRFCYSIELDPKAQNCCALKLMFQPIIENAILHGLGDKKMRILISVRKIGQDILIEVSNDGVPISDEKIEEVNALLSSEIGLSTEHIGLHNIQKRIQLHFGEEYGLKLKRGEETTVQIRLRAIDIDDKIIGNAEGI